VFHCVLKNVCLDHTERQKIVFHLLQIWIHCFCLMCCLDCLVNLTYVKKDNSSEHMPVTELVQHTTIPLIGVQCWPEVFECFI
ncbi:hypothetical protein C8R44DRAFT_762297, partial [Mycena epipterygia]